MSARLRPHPARATLTFVAVILALAVAGVFAFGGSAAYAVKVGCGDTITADTTLHKDLVGCPNNGIVIGADNVTLDLNGHTIDGDGTDFAGCNPNRAVCDTGVVDDGHDGVAVMHGRVRQFGVGVLIGTSSAGKVRNNHVLGVSSVKNRFLGFGIFSSIRSLVRNSSGSRATARHGGLGIALGDSRDARIIHSTFRGNSDHGIFVASVSDSLIKRNLFSRDGGAIFLIDSDRNEVRSNRCVRNNICILVGPGNQNAIVRNRAFQDVAGIWIENGRGNLVARNAVVGAREVGVRLGSGGPPIGGGSNVVRRNLVRGTGGDGFRVDRKDDHSLLRRNLAVGAGDDGFDVRSRTTKLTGNRALRNADLGIDAVRGVTDGGGNRARGNGDPRQCTTNIVCR